MMNNYNSLSTGFITGLKTRLQNKGLLFLLFAFFSVISVNAQFTNTTVTKNAAAIAGSPFASLFDAINAVNALTIDGPVVVTCGPGTETAPFLTGGYSITATGTAINTIIIQGNGAANSIITAPSWSTGSLNDAVFKILGGDYITIQGFTMQEGAGGVTLAGSNNMTEWGVALLYATGAPTNGAQNCTIQNNTIILNRNYQNTFGIYSNSTHTLAAVGITATATGTGGGNSGLKIYGNSISNVNNGIVVVGPTAAADMNTGIDIGGSGGAQANTITNYGTTGTFSTYANVSGTVYGILIRNSIGYNISFNSITSSIGGTTSGTLRGIYNVSATITPTGTYTNSINNNTIALTYGVSTGTLQGITVEATNATTTSTGNINNNNFTALTASIATSAAITAISTVAPHLTVSISGNTFTNITTNTSGSFTFFGHSYTMPASGSQTLNNNSIVTAFNKTTAGGTVTISTSSSSSPNGSTHTFTNNNFSNITVTGATAITGVSNSDGSGTSANRTVTGNTFNSWTGGTSAITGMTYNYIGATSNFSSNTFSNITGQSSITALNFGSSFNGGNPLNVNSNAIFNLSSTGTGGAVNGLVCSNTSAIININNNTIRTLASTGASAVTGINITGATNTSVFKNTISDLSGSNASSTVNGIAVSSGTTVTLSNNRIGDLRATAANAANPLNGINITGGTTVNAYFNTVNLSGASSGALFGSSAISASTTPTVTLNNNIFVNNSSANGAGLAVAYRRSTATLTSYGATSNNNDFFATTIYTDGTLPNTLSGLSAYKTLVAARDSVSTSENPSFTSTVSGNANFLKINTAISTQLESGAVNIAGITDDFENDIRQGNGGYAGTGSAPDMGADEFNGIPAVVCTGTPAVSTINGAAAVCSGLGTTLSLSIPYTDLQISYQWQSSTTPGGPYTNLGTSSTQATGNLTSSTYYICVITCGNGGLSYTTVEKSVLVNALPSVTLSPSTGTYCSPGGTAVALTAGGASTYTYTNNATLSPTTGANVSATPTATTTYVVTGTDGNGCINTASSTISVAPAVFVQSITASPSSVCAGTNSQLNAVAGKTTSYTMTPGTFGLLTATGTVTNTATGDDSLLNTVALPFNVSFFGNGYSNILIYSNGYVAFQTGVNGSPYNQAIPNTAAPDNFIAISHDDLNVTAAGQLSYFTNGTAPNRIFVINYNGVKYYNSAANNGDLTGQIQIFEADQHIEIHVQNSVDPVLSAKTLGIENVGGTLGYSPATRNNVSYDVTAPEAWKFNPSGGTISYDWSANSTFLSATNIANPVATAVTSNQNYSVTVSGGGCSTTATTSVSLAAGISNTNPVADTKCAGQTAMFSVIASGPGTLTYQWRKDGVAIPVGGNASAGTATLSLPSVTALDAAIYSVFISTSCGLPVTTLGAALTVNPSVANISVSPSLTVCSGTSVTLTEDGVGNNAWSWSPGGAPTNAITVTPTATTTYTVTTTATNTCTNSASVTITVSQPVVVSSTTATPATVCSGANTQLNVAASNSSAYCVSTHTSGCSGDNISSVVLNTLNNSTGTTCGGTSRFTYFNGGGTQTTTLSATGGPYSLTLAFGTDSNQYFGAWIDYNNDGVYEASEFLGASANAGASGTTSVSFSVPGTAFNGLTRLRIVGGNDSAVTATQACGASSSPWGETQDYDVTITNATPNTGLAYAWTESPALPVTLSATNIANPMANSITVDKTYTVIATGGACSSPPATVSVAVSAGAAIVTPYPQASSACVGGTATFTVEATGPSLTYQWRKNGIDIPIAGNASAGTATLSLSAVTIGDSGSSYDVVVSSACGSPVTTTPATLTVVTPLAGINASATTICSGNPVTLTENGGSATAWSWSPGGATTNAITVSPAQTTTYTVTATTVVTGCTATANVTINVNQSPSAVTVTPTVDAGQIYPNLDGTSTICAGNIVKLSTSGGTVAGSGIANISFGTNLQSFGPATTSTANITGIPSGATITSAELQFTNVNAIGSSFRSEIRVALTGAHSLGATSISALSSAGLISPDPVITLPGFTAATGAIDLVLSESFDDGGATVVDATFGEVKLVINYTFPTLVAQSWSSTPSTTLYTDAAATPGNEYVSGPATILYAKPTGTTTYTSTALNGSCPAVGNTTVNVKALPTVTVAPITICSGSTGTLTAVSPVTEANTYSWTGGLTTIPNGDFAAVNPTVNTTYQVTATTNSPNPTCSSAPVSVLVTVNNQGGIDTQPVSQSTSVGNGASFSVAASGGVYTYQWQIRTSTTPDGSDIYGLGSTGTWSSALPPANYSGATTATLTVSNAIGGAYPIGMNGAVYRCVLIPLTPCTPFATDSVTLSVLAIGTSNPQNLTICLPASVSPLPQFNVVTNGTGTITRALWEVSSNNFATFTTIPLYLTGGNLISSGYTGPNTTAVSGLTFEFPLVGSVRDYKTLTISGINSTTFNGLRFRVRFNNTIVSQSALLTVSSPIVIDPLNSFTTSAIPVCQVPAPVSPTVLTLTTSGTVSGIVWKYATSAGASDASYSPVTDSTPAGATYVSSNPSTGVYQLSVLTTAATPLGNYYYKAFLTGVSPCSDTQSVEATIFIVRPTVTVPSSTAAYCTPGPALTLTASGALTYAWTPTTGLSPANGLGASVSATPGSATLYTVTGTNLFGCTNTATVNVTVGASFTATALATPTTVCPGAPVALSATSTLAPVSLLAESFETFPTANFATAGTGVTAATNTTYFQQGTKSVKLTYVASANGSYASTSNINLTTVANPIFTFNHICATEAGWDYGRVEYSIDGGTNWVAFPTSSYSGSGTLKNGVVSFDKSSYTAWNSQFTSSTSTPGTTAVGNGLWKTESLNLAAYTGSSQFRIRFRITADTSVNYNGWYLDNLSITGNTPLQYLWSSSPGTFTSTSAAPTANPAVTTIYTVTATVASTGCSAPASTTVTVDSAPPAITSTATTQTLCSGASATFAVTATSPTTLTYQWKKNGVAIPSATSATLTGTTTTAASTASNFTSGNYTVDVIGCTTVTSDPYILNVNPLPTATLTGSTVVCQNDAQPSVMFTGVVGTPPFTFTYTRTGLVGNQFVTTTSGYSVTVPMPTATAGAFTYTLVSVQDANTCSQTQTGSATVTVNALPAPPTLTPVTTVCEGGTLNFASSAIPAAVTGVSKYSFAVSSGTYTPIVGGTALTTVSTWDDAGNGIAIPLGGSFTFNGTAYTTCNINLNGFVSFGTTTVTNYVPISSAPSLTEVGIISAFGRDLQGATTPVGNISYLSTATEFIVQWTNARRYNGGTANAEAFNFQIRLNKTTNQASIVYGTFSNAISATSTNLPQVGLRGATTADFKNIEVLSTGNWSSPTAGTTNTATAYYNQATVAVKPASGLTYTFTPPGLGTYSWTSTTGFTSAVQNPSIANATPADTGAYTLEITNANGCKSSSTVNATVDRLPTAATSGSGTKTICSNATYTLTASEATANYGTIAWTLVSGEGFISNGSTSEEPTYTAAAGDENDDVTLLMTVTSNNSCGTATATASYTFHVDPLPTASTTGSGTKTICSNSSYTLTASEATANYATILWTVQSGAGAITAGSTTEEPTYSAVAGDEGNDVTLLMTVTSNNTCGTATATASYTFHVDPLPTAATSGSGTKSICSYSSYTLTAAEATANYGTIQWTVQSGAGSITAGSTTEEPTYSAAVGDAGNNVTLLMTVTSNNACGTATATATYTLYVYPIPTVTTVLVNKYYYAGFPTAAIPLAGTPSGVTFNITGGAAAGLADVYGVSAIPSFIPTTITTTTTVTVTPVANGCTGIPKTYQIIPIPVIANITATQCGTVNHGLNNQIQAGNVSVLGYTTTGYRFEVTNTATGEVAYVDTVQSMFKLTDTSIYAYGTAFTIRVAVILNGNVQGFFGNTCTLTTASVQTTKVVTAQCGATLAALTSTINANSVGSTNLYRFRVALASAPTTYYYVERTVPNFNLSMVVGLPLTFETEYRVDVQIRVKLAGFEAWSQFGAVCSVFTPAAPTTKLTDGIGVPTNDCEATNVSNTQILNIKPITGATSYRVKLTAYDVNGDLISIGTDPIYDQFLDTVSTTFTLSQFAVLPTNAAFYNVEIAINFLGNYTPYGQTCSIYTPLGSAAPKAAIPFKAVAYPNPFANNFMIDVKSSSESTVNLKVYDMIGRLVEQRDVRVSDLENATIGERYPSGVYNVVVSQDESVQTVRVVKR